MTPDMIKNTCVLVMSCQRSCGVFELEDDEVQQKEIYVVGDFFPASVWGILGEEGITQYLWIADCLYVLNVPHMYDILQAYAEIYLTFLYENICSRY